MQRAHGADFNRLCRLPNLEGAKGNDCRERDTEPSAGTATALAMAHAKGFAIPNRESPDIESELVGGELQLRIHDGVQAVYELSFGSWKDGPERGLECACGKWFWRRFSHQEFCKSTDDGKEYRRQKA